MIDTRLSRSIGLVFVALALACDRSSTWSPYPGLSIDGLEQTTVRESLPDSARPAIWTVPSEPELRIGVLDGDPLYQFSGIAGVLRLEDGRILVADQGSRQIRFYAADGRHQHTVGGVGSGPGEFQDILWLKRLVGDRVIAWDFLGRRGSIFTLNGTFERNVYLPEISGYPVLFAENAFADGAILTQAGPPRDQLDEEGREWKVVTIHRADPGSPSATRRIGEFPSQLEQEESVWAKWQVHGGVLAYIRGDRAEVVMLNSAPGTPVLLREAETPGAAEAEGAAPFSELQIDDRGSIWARRSGSDIWVVFDPTAQVHREFRQPPDFSVHEVVGGRIVGVERSELGVETVAVYRLDQP